MGFYQEASQETTQLGKSWLSEEDLTTVFTVVLQVVARPIHAEVSVNGAHSPWKLILALQLVLFQTVWKRMKGNTTNTKVQKATAVLQIYNDVCHTVLGEAPVTVTYEGQVHVHVLMLRVVRNNGPSLLGQHRLQFLQLNWKEYLR